MQEDQRVLGMAVEVLARQASARAGRTGETFDGALESVLETEAGRQLGELSGGPHRHESAHRWQQDLPRKREEERTQTRREERGQARREELGRARLVAWEASMQAERRELELRKNDWLLGRRSCRPSGGSWS